MVALSIVIFLPMFQLGCLSASATVTFDMLYAKEDCNVLFSSYEVRLVGDVKLEFSGKGNWEEVDCRHNAVPAAIIPQAIKEYVDRNYPGEKVVYIEKDRNDFEVKLSNRLELKFDKNYNVYDIDD